MKTLRVIRTHPRPCSGMVDSLVFFPSLTSRARNKGSREPIGGGCRPGGHLRPCSLHLLITTSTPA